MSNKNIQQLIKETEEAQEAINLKRPGQQGTLLESGIQWRIDRHNSNISPEKIIPLFKELEQLRAESIKMEMACIALDAFDADGPGDCADRQIRAIQLLKNQYDEWYNECQTARAQRDDNKMCLDVLTKERESFIRFLNTIDHYRPKDKQLVGPLENFKHILNYLRKQHEADRENLTRSHSELERCQKMLKKLIGDHTNEEYKEIQKVVDGWA